MRERARNGNEQKMSVSDVSGNKMTKDSGMSRDIVKFFENEQECKYFLSERNL